MLDSWAWGRVHALVICSFVWRVNGVSEAVFWRINTNGLGCCDIELLVSEKGGLCGEGVGCIGYRGGGVGEWWEE